MLLETIKNYIPKNMQEETDRLAMINFIKANDNSLSRDNLVAHFTTSTFIVNDDFTKVVFAYHIIYQNWSWIGGHNDLDDNFLNVAIKEAKEETGLTKLIPFSNDPIMLDIIHVTNHIKNNKYVGDHLHLNLTFLLKASESESLKIAPLENESVKWINIEEMVSLTNEERMKPIYEKAFNIISKIRDKE